tara:strand:+ start:1253 stop:1369 length:117 start_codon:yes stop_codon:yes gene_type:complete
MKVVESVMKLEKRFCKEFSFIAGMLKVSIAEGKNPKEK